MVSVTHERFSRTSRSSNRNRRRSALREAATIAETSGSKPPDAAAELPYLSDPKLRCVGRITESSSPWLQTAFPVGLAIERESGPERAAFRIADSVPKEQSVLTTIGESLPHSVPPTSRTVQQIRYTTQSGTLHRLEKDPRVRLLCARQGNAMGRNKLSWQVTQISKVTCWPPVSRTGLALTATHAMPRLIQPHEDVGVRMIRSSARFIGMTAEYHFG